MSDAAAYALATDPVCCALIDALGDGDMVARDRLLAEMAQRGVVDPDDELMFLRAEGWLLDTADGGVRADANLVRRLRAAGVGGRAVHAGGQVTRQPREGHANGRPSPSPTGAPRARRGRGDGARRNDASAVCSAGDAYARPGNHDPAATSARCVAAPRPDGGTSFMLAGAPLTPELRRAVEQIRRSDERDLLITLSTPDGGTLDMFGFVGRQGVELVAEGRAHLRVRHDGRVQLIALAEQLWTDGYAAWAREWLDLASWWTLGKRCGLLHDAAALGWRTHELELAADFSHLGLAVHDEARFVGAGNKAHVRTSGIRADETAETITVGGRNGRVRNGLGLSTHDKTRLLERDGNEASETVYGYVWLKHEWTPGEPVRRVEFRLHGRALVLEDECGASLDLTDPAALADAVKLAAMWTYCAGDPERPRSGRLRLVAPTRTRLRRCRTDPRWVIVQRAARLLGAADTETRWRRAQGGRQLTRDERVRRSMRAAVRNVADLGTLLQLPPEEAAARVLCDARFGDELRRSSVRLSWLAVGFPPEPSARHVAKGPPDEPKGRALW